MRAVLMVLILLLSGCTSEEPAKKPDVDAEAESEDLLAMPAAWNIGDWWTYDMGGTQRTWVVTSDSSTHWVLDVDDSDMRFHHDAVAQTSTIGEISKTNLDGSQEAGPVQFFKFPLEANKTWSMTWDGAQFQATVTGVIGPLAAVAAVGEDGSTRSYTYDAAQGWFSSVAAFDANGTEEFSATLVDSGHNYTGNVYRWDLHEEYTLSLSPGAPVIEQFDVPAEADDIWYHVQGTCNPDGLEGDQGTWTLDAHPEDDGQAGYSVQVICPEDTEDEGTMDPHPGTWGVTATSSGGAMEARFLPRTLVTIPVDS